jgi:hypothetical protein
LLRFALECAIAFASLAAEELAHLDKMTSSSPAHLMPVTAM